MQEDDSSSSSSVVLENATKDSGSPNMGANQPQVRLSMEEQKAREPKLGGYRKGDACPNPGECEKDGTPCVWRFRKYLPHRIREMLPTEGSPLSD